MIPVRASDGTVVPFADAGSMVLWIRNGNPSPGVIRSFDIRSVNQSPEGVPANAPVGASSGVHLGGDAA